MGRETVRLSTEQKARLRRRLDQLMAATTARPDEYGAVMQEIQAILRRLGADDVIGPSQTAPVHSLAAARQAWYQKWFQKLGLPGTVPLPDVSNRDFARWQKEKRGLFFRHQDYAAFLTAIGQPKHWTLVEKDRHKVGFEPISEGNWFLGDIAPECPRLGTTQIQLMTDLKAPKRLISIEEYIAEWWAVREEMNILLDQHTWCWTRTRFGSGALYARGYVGWVDVVRSGFEYLSIPYGFDGGRSAEVVKNAA